MAKLKVAVIFGGRSAEHEISLLSARNVIEALDKERFEPILIGISKDGLWHRYEQEDYLLNAEDPKQVSLNHALGAVSIVAAESGAMLVDLANSENSTLIDVAFPVLHGPFGEDGTVQGLLQLAGLPYVGADVLGSAVGMDKDVMKRLLRDAGILTAPFFTFLRTQKTSINYDDVTKELGLPLFIKPANLGSSVGISKVESREEFAEAVELAFKFDRKIIVESGITGREIECAVLGNDNPRASVLGEIVANKAHGFYSYDAKYVDEAGAELIAPAEVSEQELQSMQALAIRSYQVLCCRGMARVDGFLTPEGEIYINEINTLPGFTKISMYPRLWELSGISYRDLISQLIDLALEK